MSVKTSDCALAGLRVVPAQDRNHFRLANRQLAMTVSIPAAGVLRIQVQPIPAKGIGLRSWSVKEILDPLPNEGWQVKQGWASLVHGSTELRVLLRTGEWAVSDRGIEIFHALPGSTVLRGQQSTLALALHARESIFGLGEATGTFDRRGLVRDFWNIDVLGHAPGIHPGLRNLYISVPFALSLRDGRAAGLFWDTPARQSWDLGQADLERWTLHAEAGEVDLYVFVGPTVPEVVGAYTQLTGRSPIPPRWALGYHQSRYSYASAKEVQALAKGFRRRAIPLDVIHLDIHYMADYRVFTFGKAFPGPERLCRSLGREGIRLVAIVDPGVKDDPDFPVLKRGQAHGAFVKQPDGVTDLLGDVWPGPSRFPDFTRASVREWWGREQAALQSKGVCGFWNDMNEPANFTGPGKTLPLDAVHQTDQGVARHSQVHNIYGMQMSRASREGSLAYDPEARPFILTRSSHAGGQRHATVWTGDNSSNWDHLRDSVQMLLNLGLSGFASCGADAGGFLENATPELYARWIQLASFTPFFRSHTNTGTRPHEPWAFGSRVESIARRFIELRYQLLQYHYALAAESESTGAPVMRPLLWHHANDPVAVRCADEFLLGRDLLVAPILQQGDTARAVYLPNDLWYDFWTDECLVGGAHHLAQAQLERIPLFVRAGAILPFLAAAPHSEAQDFATVTLNVWPGINQGFAWYEDDGVSTANARGVWHRRMLRQTRRGRRLMLELGAAEGSFDSRVRTWQLVFHDVHPAASVRVNGAPAEVLRVPEARMLTLALQTSPSAMTVEVASR